MKKFELKRHSIDARAMIRTQAKESDTSVVYDQTGVYELDGKPAIIYGHLSERFDDLVWAVKSFGFTNRATRESSVGDARTFGYRPRITMGTANFCSVCSSFESHPRNHGIICEFGKTLDAIYAERAPETYARHKQMLAEKIRPDWWIPDTLFTSGIVNRNNSLLYHYDKGNLEGVMSCMIVLRQFCKGGFLSIPEFNARFFLDDHTYLLFDGQSYLHGVTPIVKMNRNSYRYSVVYYALRKMGECGSMVEELNLARLKRRMSEKKRTLKSSDS